MYLNMNKISFRSFILLLFFILIFCFFYFRLNQYFDFSSLKFYQDQIKSFYVHSPYLTVFVYFFLYVVVTGLSIPGAVILTLAGGFLFGLLIGTVLVSFASSTGALMAFLFSRFFIKDFLLGIASRKKVIFDSQKQSTFSRVADNIKKRFGRQMEIISEKIKTEGVYYLFTLRLIPLFPFFVVNLIMGLTPLKARTFFWVSQLGMLPATVLYVNAGTQLSQLETAKDIISFPFLLSFALLGLFPLLIRYIIRKN